MNFYLQENLRAARIFLNTLGLTLEDVNDIENYQIPDIEKAIVLKSLDIYDKDNRHVGTLGFCNNKVYIKVQLSKTAILQAEYPLEKPFVLNENVEDEEKVISFNNSIDYKIFENLNKMILGNFQVYSFLGPYEDRMVSCAQKIERYKEGIKEFELKIGLDKIIELQYGTNKAIDIDFYQKQENGRMVKTDIPRVPNYKTFIAIDYETGKPYIARQEILTDEDTKESFMKDKETLKNYYFIDLLRRKLTVSEIPLFDSLASVTLSSLDDTEFNRILGFNRNFIDFQNATNLTSAYFDNLSKTK